MQVIKLELVIKIQSWGKVQTEVHAQEVQIQENESRWRRSMDGQY